MDKMFLFGVVRWGDYLRNALQYVQYKTCGVLRNCISCVLRTVPGGVYKYCT